MNAMSPGPRDHLIGQVTARVLNNRIHQGDQKSGISRFTLDRFQPEHLGSICTAIEADPILQALVEIHIPRNLAPPGLNPHYLTDQSIVYWRNREPEDPTRQVMICASYGSASLESMETVVRIDAKTLLAEIDCWIKALEFDRHWSSDDVRHLQKALHGLLAADINTCSLETLADYLLALSRGAGGGKRLADAAEEGLPVLRIALGSAKFQSIPEKNRGNRNHWRKRFHDANRSTSHLLRKEKPDGSPLDRSVLHQTLDALVAEANAGKEGRAIWLDEEAVAVARAFVDADSGWNARAQMFAELGWDDVADLFKDTRKTRTPTLGEHTLDYLEREHPQSWKGCPDDYVQHLREMKQSKRDSDEIDEDIHRWLKEELADEASDEARQLLGQWDRFVHGTAGTYEDLLDAILGALPRLLDRETKPQGHGDRKLRLAVRNSSRASTWKSINPAVCLFLASRYHGLSTLLQERVSFIETGKLFTDLRNPDVVQKQLAGKNARDAREINFILSLFVGNQEVAEIPFVWSMPTEAITGGLAADLTALATGEPLPYLNAEDCNGSPSLRKWATPTEMIEGADGCLVPDSPATTIDGDFLAALEQAVADRLLSAEAAAAIKDRFLAFRNRYHKALKAWIGEAGTASPLFLEQLEAYREFLDELLKHARRDKLIETLWAPVVQIGVAPITDPVGAVIAPWHPLRMAEIHVKAAQFGAVIEDILRRGLDGFGSSELFFADVRRELINPYYPQVCVAGRDHRLLAVTETLGDYSLALPPIDAAKGESQAISSEDCKAAAECFQEAATRFLELMPHRIGDLTVGLQDPPSIGLIDAVRQLGEKLVVSDPDGHCRLQILHRNAEQLRNLYRETNERLTASLRNAPTEDDLSFAPSLRLDFPGTAPPASHQSRPFDLVFLDQSVTAEAALVWESNPYVPAEDIVALRPSRISRKRPVALGDNRSVSFLVWPKQPRAGQSYLTLIQGVVQREAPAPAKPSLPAHRVEMHAESLKKLIDQVHDQGAWVVSHDRLNDRRLLRTQGIQLIRYRQGIGDDPNRIISTKAPMPLLHSLLRQRLDDLALGLDSEMLRKLMDLMIQDATDLSGYILMRAARYGKFAAEMVGVVLSRWLVEAEIGRTMGMGWFFLDDYAHWFGQKEGRIADLLLIKPVVLRGRPRVQLVVTEAKYTSRETLALAARSSEQQLRETVKRLVKVFSRSGQHIDRRLWLSRLAGMLIEGVSPFGEKPLNGWSLEMWADNLAEGRLAVEVRGYSHIFIHDGDPDQEGAIRLEVEDLRLCQQERYGRTAIVDLMHAQLAHEALPPIRRRVLKGTAPEDEIAQVFDFQDSREQLEDLPGQGELAPSTPDTASSSATVDDCIETVGEDDRLDSDPGSSTAGIPPTPSPQEATDPAPARVAGDDFWGPPVLWDWIERHSTPATDDDELQSWCETTVNNLRKALMGQKLTAAAANRRLTPNALLVRFKGSESLQPKEIEKRRELFLTVHEIEIIAIQAVKGGVIVAVKRPTRAVLSLATLWRERTVNRRQDGTNLSLLVGARETNGELLYLNIGDTFGGSPQHDPHTLIAGGTGSGKSVLVQNLILDIAVTNPPELARIYLIDPKGGLDYGWVRSLPHLAEQRLIIDQMEATTTISGLVEEMENRQRRLAEVNAENLASYNRKVAPDRRMPVIWVVHDEFAEWMMQDEYRQAVETAVKRLAVKARAMGIYLIFVAQRPDNTVFPMQLRDNLGNRLILKVKSEGTSQIALGLKGAEALLGQGHLAARLGEPDIIYAQVPFLGSEERDELVRALQTSWREQ